jgi:peroxiredoxin family protein
MDIKLENDLEKRLELMISEKLDEQLGGIRSQLESLQTQVKTLHSEIPANGVTIVAFSGDMDKLLAAFTIATGAVAMGMNVSIFFTFWGLTALKKATSYKGKPALKKMISTMLPGGPSSVGTSQMNMMGLGPAFFKTLMKKDNVASLPELIDLAVEMDIKLTACQMSMELMGIGRDELRDDISFGGVAPYIEDAADSKITLFV